MFTVKIKDTFDGANAEVYLDGVLVMACTWLGEKDEQLIAMAKQWIKK